MSDLLALSADFVLDVRLTMPEVTAGSVMRATTVSRSGRSSSLELARALRQLGHDVEIGGFLAGTNGKFIERELDAEGLPGHYVWCEGETPQHLIVTEQDDRTTTLSEQRLQIKPDHFQQLAIEIKRLRRQFDWVSFTGSGTAFLGRKAESIDEGQQCCREAHNLGIDVVILSLEGQGIIASYGNDWWHADTGASVTEVFVHTLHQMLRGDSF